MTKKLTDYMERQRLLKQLKVMILVITDIRGAQSIILMKINQYHSNTYYQFSYTQTLQIFHIISVPHFEEYQMKKIWKMYVVETANTHNGVKH